ncbi:helix-turn-helix domain-containing protein [Chloroflexota bacterium]
MSSSEVNMEKILLKPIEVAETLGIGRSLIYELIARKEIPSVRLGRCIRVRKDSLEQWLNNQEETWQNGR